MIKDISTYKKILEDKYNEVKGELDSIGKVHPNDKNDYDAVAAEMDTNPSDREEVAEKIESFETRGALEVELEKKLNEISLALDAIKNGTYGKCIVCGNTIYEKRLDVNPTAVTCTDCYYSVDTSSKL